jgi:hypothetical protein
MDLVRPLISLSNSQGIYSSWFLWEHLLSKTKLTTSEHGSSLENRRLGGQAQRSNSNRLTHCHRSTKQDVAPLYRLLGLYVGRYDVRMQFSEIAAIQASGGQNCHLFVAFTESCSESRLLSANMDRFFVAVDLSRSVTPTESSIAIRI